MGGEDSSGSSGRGKGEVRRGSQGCLLDKREIRKRMDYMGGRGREKGRDGGIEEVGREGKTDRGREGAVRK